MGTPDPGSGPAPALHVAVVGAGVTGLATAVRARAAGHRVTLVAPELPGPADPPGDLRVDGATHAAAGMLAPLTETQHSQDALAPLLRAAWERYPVFLALLAAATAAPTGHDASGSYAVGLDRADVDQWAHVLGRAERHGRRAERLTPTALRRAAPALAPTVAGGFAAPDDHSLDPRLLARACLAAVRAPASSVPSGTDARLADDPGPARLVPGRALAVHQAGRGVVLEVAPTPGGGAVEVRADVAVLAAGLGHGALGGAPAAVPLPLRPVHGDILRLRVPPRLLGPGEDRLLPGPVRSLVHGRSVYLVPRADGGLVVGATVREDGVAATPAGAVLDLLAAPAAQAPDEGMTLVVLCAAGVRSARARDAVRAAAPAAAGRVLSLAGGLRAWEARGEAARPACSVDSPG